MRISSIACLALAGCANGDPGALLDFAPGSLGFDAGNVFFVRVSSACHVQNPPFRSDDQFGLTIVGRGSFPPGAASISVNWPGQETPGPALSLTPGALADDAQTGATSDGAVTFSWDQGPNPNDVDATPVAALTVEFLALPKQDGDVGRAHVRMTFEDGRLLDFTVHQKVVNATTPCRF